MFTGIVREVGRLEAVRTLGGRTELEISAPRTAAGLRIGDSVAVNGVCLTVTSAAAARIRADASLETRRVTTVSAWRRGDRLHIEPALRVGDPLGGHFVLGHVDGVGRVQRVARRGDALAVTIAAPPAILARLLPKGSVAVDGVSLTLDEGPFTRTFTVTLVPHTLRETRFATIGSGDGVNLEVDVLSKAAAALVRGQVTTPPTRAGSLTTDAITARGWTRREDS
jgi:riboflavin synthase alpha subunit